MRRRASAAFSHVERHRAGDALQLPGEPRAGARAQEFGAHAFAGDRLHVPGFDAVKPGRFS
ncbi:hypothetical protein WS95_04610 [Burkholderia sp. MSMB1826]|nr:hypothetical protein WS95_04610 [Burkholderia sp. MSMB1826]KWE60630.1 hypothetical protein WT53_09785 [Burkholderia sp. MSMB2157WGS]